MKIIIVGIHNKAGLSPLDSSTKSGKLIDRIIERLSLPIEKTNLFNVDYLPPKEEKQKLMDEWWQKNKVTKNDIVVLLGGIVQKMFKYKMKNLIKIKHPASIWSNKDMDEYVNNAVIKITNKI